MQEHKHLLAASSNPSFPDRFFFLKGKHDEQMDADVQQDVISVFCHSAIVFCKSAPGARGTHTGPDPDEGGLCPPDTCSPLGLPSSGGA